MDCEPKSLLNVSNISTVIGDAASDIGNNENSTFSKWSDCSIETPFIPIQRDVSAGPHKKQEEKIRDNLFGNSYFTDYQSSHTMNQNKCGSMSAQTEQNFHTQKSKSCNTKHAFI